MSSTAKKIYKACEPCRRRKVRCDGEKPCKNCREKSSDCLYRQKARVRNSSKSFESVGTTAGTCAQDTSKITFPLVAFGNPNPGQLVATERSGYDDFTSPEVYQSVTGTQLAPTHTDSSQLYYGPSSTFAFLQQIHRSLLTHHQLPSHDPSRLNVRLDMFLQRSIFFGTPVRLRASAMHHASVHMFSVPVAEATSFLDHFKSSPSHVLPFFTPSELDGLLSGFYQLSDYRGGALASHSKARLLVVLAIGALYTPNTEAAGMLFLQAKQEAAYHDDTVSLPMIQFSLLAAAYLTYIGRPNSSFLHVGNACRKAFAMGLNSVASSRCSGHDNVQQRCTTLWSLYFHDMYESHNRSAPGN